MNKEEIISILSEVKDPEIPVLSISDLGILRSVDVQEDKISIQITPTYSGCPAMDTIREGYPPGAGKTRNKPGRN